MEEHFWAALRPHIVGVSLHAKVIIILLYIVFEDYTIITDLLAWCLLVTPFEMIRRFEFNRYITFIMYIDNSA